MAFIAKTEEVKPGRKYFLFMRKVVLSLIIGVMFYNIHWICALLAAGLVYYFSKQIKKYKVVYLLLGLVLFVSSSYQIFTVASLILFYGFVQGTLDTEKLLKKKVFYVMGVEFKRYYGFLFVSVIPKVLWSFVQIL